MQLIGDFVPHRIGDDDDGFFAATVDNRCDVVVKECTLGSKHGAFPLVYRIDLLLPGSAETVEKIIDIGFFDLFNQNLQWLLEFCGMSCMGELPVQLIYPVPFIAVARKPLVESLYIELGGFNQWE